MIPRSRYFLYPVTWYSVLILTGIILAVLIASVQEKKKGFPRDTIIDLALRIIPVGILSARLYYVLFSWSAFKNDFFSIFRIWEGGLAIYGGVLGGLLTILLFCRKRRLPFLSLCDAIAPGLSLAQAVGRWGNYFNMEAYGRTVTNSAFCFFPAAVLIPSDSGNVWHLATFFYESCWNLAVFIILITISSGKSREDGYVFRSYLVLYASARLVIEELREDSLYFEGVRISQLLSILLILIVMISLIYRLIHSPDHTAIPVALYLLGPVYLVSSVIVVGCVLGLPLRSPVFFSDRLYWFMQFGIFSIILLGCLNHWVSGRRTYANIKN